MRSIRKRRVKAMESPAELHEEKGFNEVEKFTKRSMQLPGVTGQALSSRLEEKNACLSETASKPAFNLNSGQTLNPSAKMKLQLFPIDEGTRLGLEKDGFNPYLELTLSARKKISSVLEHLNSKWGSASIAIGEPMLFPFSSAESLANYRWTMSDFGIRVDDVYATIGRPTVFRLRYGWVSVSQANSSELLSTSAPLEACLNFESIQKDAATSIDTTYKKVEQTVLINEASAKPIITSGAMNAIVAEEPSDGPIDSMVNEVRTESGIGQSSVLWADSLTNISIGGLLSEASLQAKFSSCDPKSTGSNAGVQSSQLITDSLDAFLAGQIYRSQSPRPPPDGSLSSILDAEDTCHAFQFQKFSSSGKDATDLGGSNYSQASSQDCNPKSFKFPSATEVNVQSGLPQDHACQESETDLLQCSGVHTDESSLGLSGIKWTESLGPFDLGLPSSRKIISGDKISISELNK